LIYGEGAETLTKGQWVVPGRLTELNFPFKYPTIEKALMQVYR
jgi:NAD dependent epimerase/dehydratase family enzyme